MRLCKVYQSLDASQDLGIRGTYFEVSVRQGRLARSFDGTWLSSLAGQNIKRVDDLGSSVNRNFLVSEEEQRGAVASFVAPSLQVSASGVEV